MKVTEVIRRLESEGWTRRKSSGGHLQFTHPVKPGRVTVSFHRGDIGIKTLRSIFKQAGWEWPP